MQPLTIPTATPIIPTVVTPDITVTLTFRPGDPIGLTAVDVSGDPCFQDILDVLDDALQRLCAYTNGYSEAWTEDIASDC